MPARMQICQASDAPDVTCADQTCRARVRIHLDRLLRTCSLLDSIADDLSGPRRQQLAAEAEKYFRGTEMHDLHAVEALVVRHLNGRVLSQDPSFYTHFSSLLRESRRTHAGLIQSTEEVSRGLNVIQAGRIPPRPIEFVIAALQVAELARDYVTWWEEKLLPLMEGRLASVDWEDLAAIFMSLEREMTVSGNR